jgi:hypothetical protein
MDLPANFTRDQVDAALEALGLKLGSVEAVLITGDRVTVTKAYAISDGGTSTFPTMRGQEIIPVYPTS